MNGIVPAQGSGRFLLRADRAATLYFFDPLRRVLPATPGIPILMYHRVPDVDTCECHPYYCTNTAAPLFERQIRFLKEEGYRTVGLREVVAAVRSSDCTEKMVAVTFDDGYRDFYTNAFPVLRRYGFTATVFLPTAYIGESARRFKDLDCLTWGQVRELRKEGMEFGSHTVTHPQLRDVDPRQFRSEIADSKQEIEQRLGEPATTFAYPYAFPEADRQFVDLLRETLLESGYREGTSTILGRVTGSADSLFMKRLPVNSHDDLPLFRAKLEGGYDWLHKAQYAAKLKSRGGRKRLPVSKA